LARARAWAAALGSGTSGGVLAPLLIMGGSLGALAAPWIPAGDAGLWAAISMGAMMGGTMRSPFTAVVFVLELTHDVNVLAGLFVACAAAHAVTVLLMKRSILTEKVARRGYHLTREYIVNPLHLLQVRDVMEPPVLQVADEPPATAYPDELLEHALVKLLEHEVELLPVVSRDDPTRVVGYVERSGIMAAPVAALVPRTASRTASLPRLPVLSVAMHLTRGPRPAFTPHDLIATFRHTVLGAPPVGTAALAAPAGVRAFGTAIRSRLAAMALQGAAVAGVSPTILTARIRVADTTQLDAVAAALRQDAAIAAVT